MIQVGRPYFSESDISEIISKMASILRSGWLTSGEVVDEFEQKFSKIINTKYAVSLNSGTAALHTILSALKLKTDEEVIVPANTFISTIFAVLYVGTPTNIPAVKRFIFGINRHCLHKSTRVRKDYGFKGNRKINRHSIWLKITRDQLQC